MNPATKKSRLREKSVWIQEGVFSLACFFYLLLWVHPTLILESQPPVFLTGIDFFTGFLSIPGGPTDWLSALSMQFWVSDFSGALMLTLSFWIVAFLTRKWMETLTEGRPVHTFHLVPVGLLVLLQGQYDYRFSIPLALIVNLTVLLLFIRWTPKHPGLRIASGILVSSVVLWITGGAFFVFAVLVSLYEIFFRRKIINGLTIAVFSAVLPYAATAAIFLVTLNHAYLHNLILETPVRLWFVGYSLPAYYCVMAILLFVLSRPGIQSFLKKIAGVSGYGRVATGWKVAVGTILVLGGTVLLTTNSIDTTTRLVLHVNRFVKEGRWTEALDSARQCPAVSPILSCQTNLALFQTGKLLDMMFTYPQSEGTGGLLMNSTWSLAWPEEASNLCWKLGLVNASLHWAHEAFEYKGSTPQILRQLGKVYMVKGEQKAAGMFLKNLKRVPYHEADAENLIQLNENPAAIASSIEFKDIYTSMPRKDLISLGGSSSRELELLLNTNPGNRMAFEYLVAYFLLEGNLKGIFTLVPGFRAFRYNHIPVHVQEALIFGAAVTPKFDQNMLKGLVEASVVKNFMEYRQSSLKYRGNKSDAKRALQKEFGGTYWYYVLFTRPAAGQSESQHDFQ